MLIDTGATAIAMNLSEAQRAGVSFAGARRVSVQNELPITLLAMSFLNQGEMQRSGRTLTLTRRY